MRVFLLSAIIFLTACANHSEHGDHNTHMIEDHSHHQHAIKKDYQKLEKDINVPPTFLQNQHGEMIDVNRLLDTSSGVYVQFIFTTCPTICPVMSTHFASFQAKAEEDIQFISISIDPTYDTPEKLLNYSKNFSSKENWTFLTGKTSDIIQLQKAFDNYAGNKMYHQPATYFKNKGATKWTVYDGFIDGPQLLAEFKGLNE